MKHRMLCSRLLLTLLFSFHWDPSVLAQSFHSSLSGFITDPSGSAVPGALLTVKAVDTLHSANAISDDFGHYSFQNLQIGKYQITVTAPKFKEFIQRGITLLVNQAARLDIHLELGGIAQTIEVNADVSPINFETATLKRSINPDVISELPLLMSGNIRSAASFVTLLPGVNTGSGSNPTDARINGGLLNGDEVILDGVSMGEGLDGDTGHLEQ